MPIKIPGSSSTLRLCLAALLIAASTGFRAPLEATPITHIIIQFPMLAWAGWLIADVIIKQNPSRAPSELNAGGVAGLLIAIFAVAFWMLPRSIDAALTTAEMEWAKFLSVPFLIGAPLRLSWHRAHLLLRGFLKANALSMLGVLAWLYTAAPIRVCNSYLIDDQRQLGVAFLFTALGLTLAWSWPLFFGNLGASRQSRRVPFPIKGIPNP